MARIPRTAALLIIALICAFTPGSTARADCGVALSGRWLCKTHNPPPNDLVPLSNVHLELRYDQRVWK